MAKPSTRLRLGKVSHRNNDFTLSSRVERLERFLSRELNGGALHHPSVGAGGLVCSPQRNRGWGGSRWPQHTSVRQRARACGGGGPSCGRRRGFAGPGPTSAPRVPPGPRHGSRGEFLKIHPNGPIYLVVRNISQRLGARGGSQEPAGALLFPAP